MIEEFMLLANETIAKEFRKKRLPGIFRVHPDPDPENLEELRGFLQLFGISWVNYQAGKKFVEC